MLTAFALLPSRPQEQMPNSPYDYWVNPAGDVSAEFYRTPHGYLVRFPGQADFHISRQNLEVSCSPSPDASVSLAQTLFQNSILPIVGDHQGQLHLHGSAVAIGNAAVAFLGASRRGKTTLAGAFARSGYPFLSEDVIKAAPSKEGYTLSPQGGLLRLFPDSAGFLIGGALGDDEGDGKTVIKASALLPFCDQALALRTIFILGPGAVSAPRIRPMSQSAAIGQLLQQSFILDVEDAGRLRGHFERIGSLGRLVPCFELDYPRSFDQLDNVIDAVVKFVGTKTASAASMPVE